MISNLQPSVGQEEAAAVAEVFASNWLGHGARTRAFEEEFAAHLGVPADSVVFVNSGTAGLFLTVQALGLGPGDEVVLPSISFLAAANAISSVGATPVFCDVDEHSLNPGVEDIEAVTTPRTAAVVVLHYGGGPGSVVDIARWCRERGLPLIEDSACAVASTVDGTACGTFGDFAMWSFDAMKVLVTGDGGMVYARDPAHIATIRRLAYHGLDRTTSYSTAGAKVSHRWWELDVREFGGRSIGNDVTAAIGRVQLRRLPGFIRRRREIVALYEELLAGIEGVRTPPLQPSGHDSSHYFYWIQLAPALRDVVAADLLEAGIYTTFRYPPLHKVPVYGGSRRPLPGTDAASERTLLLPIHQNLTDDEVRTVCAEIRASVGRRSAERGDADLAGAGAGRSARSDPRSADDVA